MARTKERRLNWKRGDAVEATVVESISQSEFIVRYGGIATDPAARLMRVRNETGRHLAVGEMVMLRVMEVDPLRFQYIESASDQRRRGRIDVSV